MKRLQVGLAGITYYNGFNPFLNWWKAANYPQITRSAGGNLDGAAIWSAGGYLDTETGEIVSPAPSDLLTISRLFFSAPSSQQVAAGCNYAGERWIAKWDGSATGVITGLTGGSQTASAGQIDFTMGTPGDTRLTLTLTNPNDPPRNIRIYQHRYESNVNAGEKFNPEWLTEIAKVGIFRTMDWQATNINGKTDYSQIPDESYLAWGQGGGDYGPKAGMPLSLICELANLTGCAIHFCIPVKATDACVTSIATYFKANTTKEVIYEFSNEHWNSSLAGIALAYNYCNTQSAAMPGNPFSGNGSKWYGYRAAAMMKIIRDVYNDTPRWSGALASQAANTQVTSDAIAGVNYWRANVLSPANSLAVDDLFDDLHIAGYFGEVIAGKQIVTVTNANPGAVTIFTHGFSNGQRIKLFMDTGMTELNNTFATVTLPLQAPTAVTKGSITTVTLNGHGFPNGRNIRWSVASGMTQLNGQTTPITYVDANTFTIAVNSSGYSSWISDASNTCYDANTFTIGVNTTGYSAFTTGNDNSYAVDAKLFDLMDTSNSNFVSDPVTYPTKYSHFNTVMKQLYLTGSSNGIFMSGSLALNRDTWWPAHKALADASGLGMRQYEGGNHYTTDAYLSGFSGNSQFIEYMIANGHCQETADVYKAMYLAWIRMGGTFPSKFVIDGPTSKYGTWAGIRFWKLAGNGNTDDAGNPVWTACLDFCQNPQPETYTVKMGGT